MYLVDTSVWIAVFRVRDPLDLEAIVPFEETATCLPIVQEVLQGFRDEKAFRLAADAFDALPTLESPLRRAVFDEAVDIFRAARKRGVTVRSSVDCLIAACALRNDAEVVHSDRDFEALTAVVPLRQRRVR